ncbi:MAG: hypothetical protein WBD16_06820 [Pyrinomonadaceae bacterium]
MKRHPYLRAYMAGITIPTIMLIFIMIVFTIARYGFDVSISIEKIIVFPMAVVPNLWGLWNILYVYLRRYRYLPIGFHGSVLALLQALLAFGIAKLVNFEIPELMANAFPFGLPIVVIVFYLVWKNMVAFLNGVLGIE